MSYSDPWKQYFCTQCDHINFVPPHGINHVTIPCAYCREVALTVLDVALYTKMPTFRANPPSKPGPVGV
jgi:hypothetical protein